MLIEHGHKNGSESPNKISLAKSCMLCWHVMTLNKPLSNYLAPPRKTCQHSARLVRKTRTLKQMASTILEQLIFNGYKSRNYAERLTLAYRNKVFDNTTNLVPTINLH